MNPRPPYLDQNTVKFSLIFEVTVELKIKTDKDDEKEAVHKNGGKS